MLLAGGVTEMVTAPGSTLVKVTTLSAWKTSSLPSSGCSSTTTQGSLLLAEMSTDAPMAAWSAAVVMVTITVPWSGSKPA